MFNFFKKNKAAVVEVTRTVDMYRVHFIDCRYPVPFNKAWIDVRPWEDLEAVEKRVMGTRDAAINWQYTRTEVIYK
jgi:hypothetical protein